MSIWIACVITVGIIAAFTAWVIRIVRQNDKLNTMADAQKQRADAAEDVSGVLVNDNWADRLRDKAEHKPKD